MLNFTGRLNRLSLYFYSFFLFGCIYVSVISFFYLDASLVATSLPRLYFATIIPLLLLGIVKDDQDFVFVIRIFVFVYLIAVGSYIYQFLFGPIGWLDAAGSPRAGLSRYATTLGSLTIYGTSIGSALLAALLFYHKPFFKYVIIAALLVGLLFSMQRAAIANGMLVTLIYLQYVKVRKLAQGLFILSFFLLIFIAYGSLFPESLVSQYTDGILLNTFGVEVFNEGELRRDTRLTSDHILERIYGSNYQEYYEVLAGPKYYLLGVGLVGGGGSMGIRSPQAHNSFWDLLNMGGAFFLVTFCTLFVYCLVSLRSDQSILGRFFFYSNIIYLINIPMNSGLIFHPIASFLFFLSVLYVLTKKRYMLRSSRRSLFIF